MKDIHQARIKGTSVRLVQRAADYVIVIDEGRLAMIDPRGRNRDHAVDCWINTVALADANPFLLSTALGA